MSRVHDALRRAERSVEPAGRPSPPRMPAAAVSPALPPPQARPAAPRAETIPSSSAAVAVPALEEGLAGLLDQVEEVPFQPAAGSLLVDLNQPYEAPMEEFRTLRTRLNHMKSLQPLHSVVVTSPSPAEGKSVSAANLALAQSHLAENYTLLADFDFRRPIIHNLFGLQRGPGITDYLMGKVPLHQAMRRIAGTPLYIMPAGEAVINPLELLNLKEVRILLDRLPSLFNWIILDSPPLLFAADANLLSTLCHGTLLVVRIGHTTVDSVARSMQSLCNNNVLGVVVNAARRGELYSKYTYYQTYYAKEEVEAAPPGDSAPA